MNCWFN